MAIEARRVPRSPILLFDRMNSLFRVQRRLLEEEAPQRMTAILDGAWSLSNELLVPLFVFRGTGLQRESTLHMTMLVVHCVTDGAANGSLMQCLLDTPTRGGAGGEDGDGNSFGRSRAHAFTLAQSGQMTLAIGAVIY